MASRHNYTVCDFICKYLRLYKNWVHVLRSHKKKWLYYSQSFPTACLSIYHHRQFITIHQLNQPTQEERYYCPEYQVSFVSSQQLAVVLTITYAACIITKRISAHKDQRFFFFFLIFDVLTDIWLSHQKTAITLFIR